MARLSEASTDADRKAKTRSFLKPLRERQAVLGEAEPLEVAAAERKQTTFHAWLSEDPESERGRAGDGRGGGGCGLAAFEAGGRAASSEETSPSPSTARVGSSPPPARVPAPRKPRAASVEDSRTSVTMEALEEGDEEEEAGSIDRRHAARNIGSWARQV